MVEYISIHFNDGAPDTSGNSKRTSILATATLRLYRDTQNDPGTVVLEDTARGKVYEYPWASVRVAKRRLREATVRPLEPERQRTAERGR